MASVVRVARRIWLESSEISSAVPFEPEKLISGIDRMITFLS